MNKIMSGTFTIAILLVIVFLSNQTYCWAATYYVDASSGDDNNNGTSQQTPWKSIDKVNKSIFYPGDSILFKRGGVWLLNNYSLAPTSSGSVGNPIVFGAYGSGNKPEIRMVTSLISWIQESPNIYYSMIPAAVDAKLAWEGDIELPGRTTGKTNLGKYGDWWLDIANSRFYMYKTSSPLEVQVTQVNYAIYVDEKSYITFQNLKINRTNQNGILFHNPKQIIVDGVDIRDAFEQGTSFWNNNTTADDITIKNCEISYCGGSGILAAKSTNGIRTLTIANNKVHDNCRLADPTVAAQQATAGIKIWGDGGTSAVIEGNEVYSNGNSSDQNIARGIGIWIDEWADNQAIVRYNTVYKNTFAGIQVENHNGTQVYYNVVYNNGSIGTLAGAGINIYRNVSDSKVLNNTVFNNYVGIAVVGGTALGEDHMTNNKVINNIAVKNVLFQLDCRFGANDIANGNSYENNCFGIEQANLIQWGSGTAYSTYDAWEAVYGNADASIKADPMFVNITNYNFHLLPTSACIGGGYDVGLMRDFQGNLLPLGLKPDVGAFQGSPIIAPSPPTNMH